MIVKAVAAAAFGLLASFHLAEAQGQLGSWVGPLHSVPAGTCNPHCQIFGSGTPEGEGANFDDQFPQNVLLDASNAKILCSNPTRDDGCGISSPLFGVVVDNATHVVHIHGIAHGPPLTVQAVVPILTIR